MQRDSLDEMFHGTGRARFRSGCLSELQVPTQVKSALNILLQGGVLRTDVRVAKAGRTAVSDRCHDHGQRSGCRYEPGSECTVRSNFERFRAMKGKTVSKTAPDRSLERNSRYHRRFALMAAKEAERVLPIFEQERPKDNRPREAIEAIRAWALRKRELGMAEVRRLSLGAHVASARS